MLHTGRVGSTVVARMLARHPNLRWDGEIFEHRSERSTFSPFLDLRARIGSAARAGRCYGFETKHHYDHHGHLYGLRVGPYVERLTRLGFDHFIEIRRENYLRQIVSGTRLRQTGQSHAPVGERVEHPPIGIDPRSVPLGRRYLPLRERFAQMDALHAETLHALQGRHVLHLTYERDIEQDPTAAYVKICEFIGLDPTPPEVALRRTNDAPLADLIANFNEVADDLAGTQYEWMLEE